MSIVELSHVTRYSYDAPVHLDPHVVRLCPRSDGGVRVLEFTLEVDPSPAGMAHGLDVDGNCFEQVWFDGTTTSVEYRTHAKLSLTEVNPLEFLVLPLFNTRLPLEYIPEEQKNLARYVERLDPSPSAARMAQEVASEYRSDAVTALLVLAQRVGEHCNRMNRHEGPPYTAEETYQHKEGACRDLTVLFMDSCRSLGLPARFVSGYSLSELAEGDHELHAWAEVYLPGAGWRGFDPSQGTITAERHVAVAAAATPEGCIPVAGAYRSQGAMSTMSYNVNIDLSGAEVC